MIAIVICCKSVCSNKIKEVESDILPQDYIDVDCIYTPIRKVNFEIENTLWYNSKILPALVTI